MKTPTFFVLAVLLACAQLAAAEPILNEQPDVFVAEPGSAPKRIQSAERFGFDDGAFDDIPGFRRRRGRVPAPNFHTDPKPLPFPVPSPSGPCNIPTVKFAKINKKCYPKLFTPWVEVSLFTVCFTRTYFIRWKFCYSKKKVNRRVTRLRICIFSGIIACHSSEDLTCPTRVILKCSKKQPTVLIKPNGA